MDVCACSCHEKRTKECSLVGWTMRCERIARVEKAVGTVARSCLFRYQHPKFILSMLANMIHQRSFNNLFFFFSTLTVKQFVFLHHTVSKDKFQNTIRTDSIEMDPVEKWSEIQSILILITDSTDWSLGERTICPNNAKNRRKEKENLDHDSFLIITWWPGEFN